jgi:hypothetical protein
MKWRQKIALLILGLLLGMTLMSTWQSRTINGLHKRIQALVLSNDDLRTENTELELQLYHPKQDAVLRTITVECDFKGETATELLVSKYIKQQLAFLIGRELEILIKDPYLPAQLINGQTYLIEGKSYRFKVTFVALQENALRVDVKLI